MTNRAGGGGWEDGGRIRVLHECVRSLWSGTPTKLHGLTHQLTLLRTEHVSIYYVRKNEMVVDC
jgi:hypothetical protein